MQVGNRTYFVRRGSVIIVPKSEFHKVINRGEEKLTFITVFEGERSLKECNYLLGQ